MFCFCNCLALGSDRLAPKAGLGARAWLRRATCRARASKSARRGAGANPVHTLLAADFPWYLGVR